VHDLSDEMTGVAELEAVDQKLHHSMQRQRP
jgi:hypothetical protein